MSIDCYKRDGLFRVRRQGLLIGNGTTFKEAHDMAVEHIEGDFTRATAKLERIKRELAAVVELKERKG